jgi:23S rRNA G2445 N2-methylase RlmL
MKWVALCHLGAEQAVTSELEDHSLQATQNMGSVSFEATKQQAADFLYYSQCTIRLLAEVAKGAYKDLDISQAHQLIPEDATFCVRAEIIAGGPGDTSSQEIAYEYGAQINRPVDLDEPQYTIYAQVGSETVAGIDVSGDLSKRYYRIFTNSRSMKGTLVASALRIFGVRGLLLDPFANTGEVCIEAALKATHTSHLKYRKFEKYTLIEDEVSTWNDESEHKPEHEIHCYDNHLGNLRSCKKNGKLAGVQNSITFSKTEPEWMDVKFNENDLGSIITIPPPVTNRNPESDHLEELCYQAEWVLKNKGKLVVFCLTAETAYELAKHAEKYDMKPIKEHVLYSGKLAIQVVEYGL